MLDGKAMLHDLLNATERRYKELDRTKPPAFLLYLDQSEELYVRAEEHQRRRFSEVIARGVADPRLYTLPQDRVSARGTEMPMPCFRKHVWPLAMSEWQDIELLSISQRERHGAELGKRKAAEEARKEFQRIGVRPPRAPR